MLRPGPKSLPPPALGGYCASKAGVDVGIATKQRVPVVRVGSAVYAFDDIYESANGRCPLSAGLLDGTVIMSQRQRASAGRSGQR